MQVGTMKSLSCVLTCRRCKNEQTNVNNNLLWNLKKKSLIILGCIFNSSYCVNESFEDIKTFPGYPRTVWKRDLNAETRFPSPLVNSDLGMVYFEFNPRRKTEMDFCFRLLSQ